MFTLPPSWGFLCTSPTQQIKRTECYVLGTPSTQGSQYLTLSTSPVLTTGDTSSTTTTGLTNHILTGIVLSSGLPYVRWRFTVICNQAMTLYLYMKLSYRLCLLPDLYYVLYIIKKKDITYFIYFLVEQQRNKHCHNTCISPSYHQ